MVLKFNPTRSNDDLLYLCFFEFDVLTSNGIVLLKYKLLSRRAGVLLRDVEEAGTGGRQQFDLSLIHI